MNLWKSFLLVIELAQLVIGDFKKRRFNCLFSIHYIETVLVK
jgi:hypothetical protein